MSRTAGGAAFCRLVEQSQPPGSRLFVDPVVGRLVDPMLATMAASPLRHQLLASFPPGVYGCQVMRTRYIDDIITTAAASGLEQLVVLGAGLDTRAYRLPALASTIVFEVDLPDLQRLKRSRLGDTRPLAREVRFVAVDLDTEPLGEALDATGLDRERPVLYVWEGVTQYLTEAGVRATLAFVGGATAGSALVFTYVVRHLMAELAFGGTSMQFGATEPWVFGLEPADVPCLLDASGLELVSDVGAADYRARYLEPIGRDLLVHAGERVAFAVVRG